MTFYAFLFCFVLGLLSSISINRTLVKTEYPKFKKILLCSIISTSLISPCCLSSTDFEFFLTLPFALFTSPFIDNATILDAKNLYMPLAFFIFSFTFYRKSILKHESV